MSKFIPWNSQPLDAWANRYAEGTFIDLAGRRTHYLERGQGSPVILIHGFNLDSNTWIKNIDALSSQFKVYALDLWGQGYSTREKLDYDYDLFEEQIRLFMEAMHIEKASLVGHSMGAGTAIVVTLKNRDKIDKLVLVNSTGIPTRLPLRARLFKLKGVAHFLMSLNTKWIRRKNLKDVWIYDPESLTEVYYNKFVQYQKIEGSTEVLVTILRKDFFNTLEDDIRALDQLAIPTFIIWGRNDVSLPLHCGQKMHQCLSNSSFEILEKAGHLSNFDRAETFNRLVIDFLNRTN